MRISDSMFAESPSTAITSGLPLQVPKVVESELRRLIDVAGGDDLQPGRRVGTCRIMTSPK